MLFCGERFQMINHLAITHKHNAVIRAATDGVTDLEWEHGCRSIQLSYKQELIAYQYVKSLGYDVLTKEEWSEYMNSLDPDIVTSNKFVSTRVIKDKWDGARDVY